MSVSMADVPVDQRPRERLQSLGAQALSDAELLALLLRNGVRGQNVLELATAMLADYGGLAAMATARPEELARRAGVGIAKATALVAAFHLGSRVRGVAAKAPQINSARDVVLAARPLFVGARTERLLVLVCDAQDRVRRSVFVAEGAIDGVDVPVREILNTVLRHDGRAFAVAHNHPSGDPEPSWDDIQVTKRLVDAADTVGLRFLDHVVLGGEKWASVTAVTRRARTRGPS